MADVPAFDTFLSRIKLLSPEQTLEPIFGPFLLSSLRNTLDAYVQAHGQVSGPQPVDIVLQGPIAGAQLSAFEIVATGEGGLHLDFGNLQDALNSYSPALGQASGPQSAYAQLLPDTSGGGPPKIQYRPPQQEGIFGPFLLSDLQDALDAYSQPQGQGSGDTLVSIVLQGPIVISQIPSLPQPQIVSNQQAGGEAFLFNDLQDALASYEQTQGQTSGSQMVFIYRRLYAPNDGGGPPK